MQSKPSTDEFKLEELLVISELDHIFDSYYHLTGITVGIMGLDHEFIIRSGEQAVCKNFHFIHPQSKSQCYKSRLSLTDKPPLPGEMKIHSCLLGLNEGIMAIYNENEIIGYIVSGSVFFTEPDYDNFNSQAQTYRYRPELYLKALKEVPVISRSQLKKGLTHIGSVISSFIQERRKLLHSRKDHVTQQELLNSEINIEKQFSKLYRINHELENEIRNRKIIEAELKDNELKNHTVLSSITEGVLYIDQNGTILTANESALQILDLEKNPPEGVLYTDVFPQMYDKNQNPIPEGEDPISTALRLSTGIFDNVIAIKDGDTYFKWISINSIPLFRENESKAYSLVISFSNITKRKLIEEERQKLIKMLYKSNKELSETLLELKNAQKQIITQEKLASLGALTAGIAHEIHNPLNFVNNFAELSIELTEEIYSNLKNEILPQSEFITSALEDLHVLKQNIEKILSHGKRVNRIINAMLFHTQDERSYEFEQIEVNKIVEESMNLAHYGSRFSYADFKVNIITDYDDNIGNFSVASQNISRVLLNIFHNAFYFLHEKWINNHHFDPELFVQTRGDNTKVEIIVRDNGIGIEKDIQDKIFNPFFTTKKGLKGIGLGLSISYDIICNEHHGNIEVTSEPGEKTEFKIILPRDNKMSR